MFDEHDYDNKEQETYEHQDPGFVEYKLASHPQQAKKNNGGTKLVALALACALIGGAAGGGAVYMANRSSGDTATAQTATMQTETTAAQTDETASTAETADTGDTGTTSGSNAPMMVTTGSTTTALDPSEVYAQNVNAVVGINVTSTTTNYFGQASSTAASGSGFIITSDGYIVTNAHVVAEDGVAADTVKVVLTSGESYDAEIVGYDTDNDVALIKIEATSLPTVSIGDSDSLVVGQQVCAIGNPLGELTNTLTVGYVSALDREINTDGTPINMLQTDCAINPGNSGGPLFDLYGNVIGITTAKYSTSSSTTLEGLGFALPINDVMTLVADIQQNGYVTGKPYLGIYLEDLNVTMASYYNLPVGVYVRSTVEGSCAEKAGVQSGDIITALGDTTIQTYTELSAAMRDYKAGDTATLTVYRNNESIQLTVTFDEKVPDYVTEAEEEETAEEESSPYSSYGNMPFSSFFGGIPSTGSSDTEDSGNAA
jgi:serine protease Do